MALRLLKRAAVAELLDVSEKTVQRWVADGSFPPPVTLPNGDERWNSAIVEGWICSRPGTAVKRNSPGQTGTEPDRAGQIDAPAGEGRKGR